MKSVKRGFAEKSARREPSKCFAMVTSSAVACALMVILMSGLAGAQVPKDSQTPATNATPLAAQTSDGRAFSALSEKDVDALADADFDASQKWRIRGKEQELARVTAENAELEKTLAQSKASGAQKDGKFAAQWSEMRSLLKQVPENGLIPFLKREKFENVFRNVIKYKLPDHEEAAQYLRLLTESP